MKKLLYFHFILLGLASGVFAVDSKTVLGFDLYFTPESVACKPDGYPGCEKLSYEGDILGWDGRPYISTQSFLLGEQEQNLKLSEEMRTNMVDLLKRVNGEAGSAVFVFDISGFHGQFISVERIVNTASMQHLSNHQKTQYIESGTKLIDHVSLYTIAPQANTSWKVTVGADTWEFSFE